MGQVRFGEVNLTEGDLVLKESRKGGQRLLPFPPSTCRQGRKDISPLTPMLCQTQRSTCVGSPSLLQKGTLSNMGTLQQRICRVEMVIAISEGHVVFRAGKGGWREGGGEVCVEERREGEW